MRYLYGYLYLGTFIFGAVERAASFICLLSVEVEPDTTIIVITHDISAGTAGIHRDFCLPGFHDIVSGFWVRPFNTNLMSVPEPKCISRGISINFSQTQFKQPANKNPIESGQNKGGDINGEEQFYRI